MKFYWFGDSWVFGDELSINDRNTQVFAKIISDHFQAECINLSICGSSINSLTHEFIKIASTIDPKKDIVFFGLTSNIRISIFDETGLKNILPSGYDKHNLHPHTKEWYKYFDSSTQRVYNYDCNTNLLYLLCKELGIQCYFYNIFTTVDLGVFDYIPLENWLIPKNKCIAEYILPVIDIKNQGLIVDDCPEITSEQWHEQKVYVDKYIKPCYCHPNIAGHKKIAEELIKCLNYKTKQTYNTSAE